MTKERKEKQRKAKQGEVMYEVVYSKRVNIAYRNPLLLIVEDRTELESYLDRWIDPGDEPVALWEFDSLSKSEKFVYENYDGWKYARCWNIKKAFREQQNVRAAKEE